MTTSLKRFEKFNLPFWVILSFFSLLLVAVLGLFMRMKMQFELPWIEQKNWQHAHSHFAFDGWITQTIWIWLFHHLLRNYTAQFNLKIQRLLLIHWLFCIGQLVSFVWQAYGFFSISFSFLSLIIRIYFIIIAWRLLAKDHISDTTIKWGIFFHLFANLSTVALVIIQVNHIKNTDLYISSIYYYLHFSYNGWFFFALLGLFLKVAVPNPLKLRKWHIHLLALSVFLTYGLSVLWLGLPNYFYYLTLLGLGIQLFFWIHLSREKIDVQLSKHKWLIRYLMLALLIKLVLQAFSAIPSLSQFVFGARPIVIAYLHFVLLAFLSVGLIVFAGIMQPYSKKVKATVFVLIGLILINQAVLGIQGFFAFNYVSLPNANYYLIGIAGLLVAVIAQLIIQLRLSRTTS